MSGITGLIVRHLAIVSLMTLLVCPGSSFGQARKVSLQELVQTSHEIVTGKCVRKESYWNEGRTKIYTNITVQTDERLKGDPGAEAVITVPGGQVGNILYEVSDMPVFGEKEEVLVFLWKHPSGKTTVTGALQGKLTIVEEKSTGRKTVQGASHLLESVGQPAAPGLQKEGPQTAPVQTVYLDDLKSTIQSMVKR